jgi:hypothetical protein
MSKVTGAKVDKLRALPSSVSYTGYSFPLLFCFFLCSFPNVGIIVGRKLGGNGRETSALLILLAVLAINQTGRAASLLSVFRLLLCNNRGREFVVVTADIRRLLRLGYLSRHHGRTFESLQLRVTPSGLAVLRDIERELSGLRVKGLE